MDKNNMPDYRIILKELGMSDADARSAAPLVKEMYLENRYEPRKKELPRGLRTIFQKGLVFHLENDTYMLTPQTKNILNKKFEITEKS